MTQLTEIREADAPSHIAAIYTDIKQSAALPQVNLIFRHFAYHEGVLEWIWASLRPLYRSQELADAAVTLVESIAQPAPSPLSDVLAGDNLNACKLVLDSYNSGNPQNLIALTALVRALKTPMSDLSATLSPRAIAPADASTPFPALPKRDELSPETMARVQAMADRHPSAPGVIPSMYLHLALWPLVLEAADAYLQPLIESPDWSRTVAGVIQRGGQTADRLAPAIQFADERPDPAVLSQVTETVEAFINSTIPELITVGRLLDID